MIFSGLFLPRRGPLHRRDHHLDRARARRPADVEEPRHRHRPARGGRAPRRRRDPLRPAEDLLDPGRPLQLGGDRGGREAREQALERRAADPRRRPTGSSRRSRPSALEERWILGRIDETRAELEELLPRFDFAHAAERALPPDLRRLLRLVRRGDQAAPLRRRRRARSRRRSRRSSGCSRCSIRCCRTSPRRSGRSSTTTPADPRPLARARPSATPAAAEAMERVQERGRDASGAAACSSALDGEEQRDLRRRRQARAAAREARRRALEAERERLAQGDRPLPRRCSRTRRSSPRRPPSSSRPSGRSSRATAPSSRRSSELAAAPAPAPSSSQSPACAPPAPSTSRRLPRGALALARASSGSSGSARCSPTLGDPQRALPGDPRRRHERQDLDDAA